jgi:hypothetical protein
MDFRGRVLHASAKNFQLVEWDVPSGSPVPPAPVQLGQSRDQSGSDSGSAQRLSRDGSRRQHQRPPAGGAGRRSSSGGGVVAAAARAAPRLMFGKAAEDMYILDFAGPFSLVQAFSAALASLDRKLAVAL